MDTKTTHNLNSGWTEKPNAKTTPVKHLVLIPYRCAPSEIKNEDCDAHRNWIHNSVNAEHPDSHPGGRSNGSGSGSGERFEANVMESITALRTYRELEKKRQVVEDELERGKQRTIDSLINQLTNQRKNDEVIAKCIDILHQIQVEFQKLKKKVSDQFETTNKREKSEKATQCDIVEEVDESLLLKKKVSDQFETANEREKSEKATKCDDVDEVDKTLLLKKKVSDQFETANKREKAEKATRCDDVDEVDEYLLLRKSSRSSGGSACKRLRKIYGNAVTQSHLPKVSVSNDNLPSATKIVQSTTNNHSNPDNRKAKVPGTLCPKFLDELIPFETTHFRK